MAHFMLPSGRGFLARASVMALFILITTVTGATGQSEAPLNPAKEYSFLELTRVSQPLYLATDFAFTPDGRILVTEKPGRIKVVQPNGDINPKLFLDLQGKVALREEEGLVSIAIHPQYEQNGYFYINYTDLDEISRLVRYKVSDTNPDVADPASAVTILSVPQPSPIHNGAGLVFGPDGYLYAGFGDGGWQNDPHNNGQNGMTLLGTILRIDVDNPDPGKAYGIPDDNPFVGDPKVLDEIWALGLRNPWRFSFDRLTGDLYIGDVGGSEYEEINLERAPSPGGFNYGWRCYEGYVERITEGCKEREAYTFPAFVLGHKDITPGTRSVCAVVGGMVYRGDPQSPLYGHYVLGDFCSGWVWAFNEVQPNEWQVAFGATKIWGDLTSFGEDADGDLYMSDYGGIFRITARILNASPRVYMPLFTSRASP